MRPPRLRPRTARREGTLPRALPGWAVAVALLVAQFLAVYALRLASFSFAPGEPESGRRFGLLFVTLGVSLAVYYAAVRHFAALQTSWTVVAWVVISSVLLRAPLLGSPPILEVDLYRYLWDGAVANAGVSPYRYSPGQATQAAAAAPREEGLRRLVALQAAKPGIQQALAAVHFPELTTIYPPVSVAVFAVADQLCRADSSLEWRVVVLKTVLVGFDLGTLVGVLMLLRLCRLPAGLAIAYGWCPLVLKELANSGHLDSVAVFFATGAVVAVAATHRGTRRRDAVSLGAGTLLGLGIGAKLFPAVIVPVLACYTAARLGITRALLLAATAVVVSVTTLAPMSAWTRPQSAGGGAIESAGFSP